ncbi:MAG TPA: hypothetical protein VKR79_09810 [Gaiellaceae bacterium]|nr:hypothetical protein [Gaiellaceae bacterium]
MQQPSEIVRRFFSMREKSPLRNAIENAALLAAIFLIFYGPRAASAWRLALGTIGVAVAGFVLGVGLTVYAARRRPR